MKIHRLLPIIILLIALSVAQAKDYYVSTSGNNNNPGTLSQPFQTIQYGADQLSPGDTLYVRAGTYIEQIYISTSGTPDNMITISGYQNERPIIDGQYSLPAGPIGGSDPRTGTTFTYAPLVMISGNYVTFEGFEVTRSRGRGIQTFYTYQIPAHHIEIKDCWVHEIKADGIMIHDSDNILVENCRVWLTNNYAPWVDGRGSTVLWGGGLAATRGSHIVIKGNEVFNTWGEGIITMCSDDVQILNNVAYDNFAAQIYPERSSYVTVDGNLVYHTGDPNFYRGGHSSPGLGFCDEIYTPSVKATPCRTNNLKVTNNIIIGCGYNLFWWGVKDTERINGFYRSLIAHNTIIDGSVDPDLIIVDGTHEGARIYNNLIIKGTGDIASVSNIQQIDFSHNFWSDEPPAEIKSANDLVTDPKLIDPHHDLQPGNVDTNWLKPRSDSPAIDSGKNIPEVTTDFFGNPRDGNPDIGAIEFYDGDPPQSSTTTTTLSATTSTVQTTTSTSTSSTTTTIILEPENFEEPDCESGLWIVLNKEGNVLPAPIIRSVKKHNPLEIQPEGHGKIKVLLICFKPNVDVDIFEKTF